MNAFKVGDRVRLGRDGATGTVTGTFWDRPPAGMPWLASPPPWYTISWDGGEPGYAEGPALERIR